MDYQRRPKLKEKLKSWAKQIRHLKSTRKQDKREGRALQDIEFDIYRLRREFRHHHIASCEMCGRTRLQIEIPSEGNKPSEDYITKIKEEWMEEETDEAIRLSA